VVIRELLGWLALVFTGWVATAAFFGSQRSGANPLPGVVYVLWWVGLVVCSVVFGPVWRIISPVRTVSYLLSGHPTVLASIKVGSVLLGHVLGVIAAHDRSLRLLSRTHQLTGQLALLLTMVTYTFGGLYLLFGG